MEARLIAERRAHAVLPAKHTTRVCLAAPPSPRSSAAQDSFLGVLVAHAQTTGWVDIRSSLTVDSQSGTTSPRWTHGGRGGAPSWKKGLDQELEAVEKEGGSRREQQLELRGPLRNQLAG